MVIVVIWLILCVVVNGLKISATVIRIYEKTKQLSVCHTVHIRFIDKLNLFMVGFWTLFATAPAV